MNHEPLVSVLMPVYNAEDYIADAVLCILNQRYQNLELIVIDDGSDDRSFPILSSFNDPRIKVIQNKENIGLTASLNKALKYAKGKYIARQDADDISDTNRLLRQVEFMEDHPEIGLCGTWIENFGYHYESNVYKTVCSTKEIYCQLLFTSCVVHSTFIIRHAYLEENNIQYNEDFPYSQDYVMSIAFFRKGLGIANIGEVLLRRRIHPHSITISKRQLQTQCSMLSKEMMMDILNIGHTEEEISFHHRLNYPLDQEISLSFLEKLDTWFHKLFLGAKESGLLDEDILLQIMKARWKKYTAGKTNLGLGFWYFFRKSIFSDYHSMSYWGKAKFFIKCVLKK